MIWWCYKPNMYLEPCADRLVHLFVSTMNAPYVNRDYVHRVGRTARAGREGWSLSFVSQYDVQLVGAEFITGLWISLAVRH